MLKLSNLESIGRPVYKFHNLHSVDFDGVDDFIELGEPISYTQHTISTWVKIGASSDSRTIFDARDAANDGVRLYVASNNKIIYELNTNDLSSAVMTMDEWAHVVATYDGTTQKLYINGSLSQSSTTTQVVNVTTNAEIGARNFSDRANEFLGKIDELAIFDRALTADEVTAIFRIKYGANLVQNGNFDELGSELVINGDFSTDTFWSAGSGWTIENNKANATNAAFTRLETPSGLSAILVVGKTYKCTFDVVDANGGELYVERDINDAVLTGVNSVGNYTVYFVATDDQLRFQSRNNSSISIDNVSVKQVDPNDRWNDKDDKFTFVNNGGKLSGNSSGLARLYAQNSSITSAGKTYKVSYTVVENNGTSLQHYDGDSYETITSTVGDHSFIYTRQGSDNNFILRNASGDSASIILTNIMLEEQKYVATNLKLKSTLFNPFTGSTLNLKNYYRFGDGILDTHPLICDMVEPSLGSELVTNGDFSSNSDWTLGTGWSITNGKLVADGTNTGFENAQQNSLTVVGKTYKVTLTIEATSGQVELKGSGVYSRVDTLGVGTHTLTFVADATYFRFLAHAWATITIDNVSVKQVNGVPGMMTNMTEADITNDVPG